MESVDKEILRTFLLEFLEFADTFAVELCRIVYAGERHPIGSNENALIDEFLKSRSQYSR